MVGIVAVTRFCESGSAAFSSYIDYIDRNEAVRKDNTEKYNLFDSYADYMDEETKVITDESKSLEKVSALFTKDKDKLSKDEKKELKDLFKSAQTNGSNMWQTVISFDNAYLSKNGIYDIKEDMLNETLLRQASRKAIDEMLKKEGLENATWAASFHRNTDNIHIHIATVEPIPMREKKEYILYQKDSEGKYLREYKDGRMVKVPVLDKEGKPVTYEGYKGTFKQKSIEALKSSIRSELENNKEVYTSITSLLRDSIITDKKERSLLDDPKFVGAMQDLYQDLKNSDINRRNWNYNQNILSPYKDKINDLSDFFIKTYHQDDFNDFVAQIEREQDRQTKAYGGDKNKYKENMLYGKEGLYARLGNAILNEIKVYDREQKNKMAEVRRVEKLLDKTGEEYNPDKAISILDELSDRGNTFAQNRLGLIYLRGEGVDRSPEKAKEYFIRSGESGDTFGQKMSKEITEKKSSFGIRLGGGSGYQNRIYNSFPARDLKRGLRLLENELHRNYEKSRNLQEAEELQREIDERGEYR